MPEPISCPNPICPQPHDVQKVSIIVAQGTMQGMIAGQQKIVGQNALSAALAAPVEPKTIWQARSISFALLLLLPLGFFLAFSSLILFIVSEEFALLSGQGQAAPFGGFVETLLIAGGASLFFGVFTYIAFIEPNHTYRRDHAKWVKQKGKWEGLYYCHRCDTVFNPTDPYGAFRPASRIKELLV